MKDFMVRRRIRKTLMQSGPAFRSVLEGLAANHGAENPLKLALGMMRSELKKDGDRHGARWGVPGFMRPLGPKHTRRRRA
jgi:hypothetical protein